jgi:hypothetical protein
LDTSITHWAENFGSIKTSVLLQAMKMLEHLCKELQQLNFQYSKLSEDYESVDIYT